MAQLSLYIDDATMEELRKDASATGVSISSYARDILASRNDAKRKNWNNGFPPGYFDLYGSSPSFPIVEDLTPDPVESW